MKAGPESKCFRVFKLMVFQRPNYDNFALTLCQLCRPHSMLLIFIISIDNTVKELQEKGGSVAPPFWLKALEMAKK